MKRLIKIFRIVALAAIIGFVIMACDNGTTSKTGPNSGNGNEGGEFIEPTVEKAPGAWYTGSATAIFGNNSLDRVWAIAAGQGKYVAVGGWRPLEEAYQDESKTNYGIAYSSDGEVWEKATGNFRTEIRTVAYGGGRFVAADVGNFGDTGANTDNYAPSATYYSTDGVTWSGPVLTGTANNTGLRSVIGLAYGDGKWLATGLDGSMMYSTNGGESWTAIQQTLLPKTDMSNAVRGAVYADDTWVVVGDQGVTAASTDLVTWTTVKVSGITGEGFQKVIYVDGILHTAGSGGNLYYSTNKGAAWIKQPVYAHDFGVQDIYNIAYGNGYFVIIGAGGRIRYSEKGEGIQVYEAPDNVIFGNSQAVYGLAYGGGKWIAGGRSGGIAFSTVN
jgi:hypothetical protein